jgi:hypothetical protein
MNTTLSLARSASMGAGSAPVRSFLVKVGICLGATLGAIVGFLVLQVIGLVVFVVVGAVAGFGLGSWLAGALLSRALVTVGNAVDARPVTASEHPRVFNLLEGLCAGSGVSMPKVSLTSDNTMNVMTLVDPAGKEQAEIIITSGIARDLSRIALEGIVATSLARIKSGRLESQVAAAAVLLEAPWFVPRAVRERLAREANTVSDSFDIDMRASSITRFPPGLAEAYESMLVATTVTSCAPNACDALWLADPRRSGGSGNDLTGVVEGSTVLSQADERPSLVERVALLREI